LAAIALLLLAIYLPPLREALRFATVTASDLIVSAALVLLLVAPAELRKAFVAGAGVCRRQEGAGCGS
jgi:Ca2+-transporting ATPase